MTGILFALFVAVIISKCCNGNKRSCQPVEGSYICYFQPTGANREGTWEEASQVCKENNSTLPTIENERILTNLQSYLKRHKSSLPDVWIAGREFRTNVWHWLDGEPIKNQTHVTGSRIFAILTKEFKFTSANNSEMHGYICKYHGNTSFSSGKNVIRLVNGFIIVHSDRNVKYNLARRKCLDDEGDLATFENNEDLTALKSNHKPLRANDSYWIGLSRLLWIPNITGLEHKNESNLTERCRFMNSTGKWHHGSCNGTKGILCQTVKSNWSPEGNEETSKNESVILLGSTTHSHLQSADFSTQHLVAIILGSIVGLAIIIAFIVTFRKCCIKNANDEADRLSNVNQTHQDECKDAIERTETCGVYAEVARTVHDDDDGCNVNEPQESIEYATLEFANNKMAKKEPVMNNHEHLNDASVSGTFGSQPGMHQDQALDINIYLL